MIAIWRISADFDCSDNGHEKHEVAQKNRVNISFWVAIVGQEVFSISGGRFGVGADANGCGVWLNRGKPRNRRTIRLF